MKERFQNIPAVLRKQILIRIACSGLGIVMILLVLAYRGSLQLLLPGLVISLAFLSDAVILFCRCAEEKYVVIQGICDEIEYTGLRKRLKAVHVQYNSKSVRIIGQLHGLRSPRIGDILEVYMADSAPVYEYDGVYLITNILAIRKER